MSWPVSLCQWTWIWVLERTRRSFKEKTEAELHVEMTEQCELFGMSPDWNLCFLMRQTARVVAEARPPSIQWLSFRCEIYKRCGSWRTNWTSTFPTTFAIQETELCGEIYLGSWGRCFSSHNVWRDAAHPGDVGTSFRHFHPMFHLNKAVKQYLQSCSWSDTSWRMRTI